MISPVPELMTIRSRILCNDPQFGEPSDCCSREWKRENEALLTSYCNSIRCFSISLIIILVCLLISRIN
jgi:hypothetical protein